VELSKKIGEKENQNPPQYRKTFMDVLDRYDKYILPAPAVIVIVAMMIFPVVFTLYLSFHTWSGGIQPPNFVMFENYVRLFRDDRFLGSMWRTTYFVGLSLVSQIVLGVITALVFHRPFFGRGLARSFFLFPMIATPSAIALVWKMMLDPTLGTMSYIVEWFGGPKLLWASSAATVIPTLAMVDTWMWTPLVMLIVLAGLAALPVEPYEAARVDGANSLQSFFYITLPLLRPTIAVAAMFRVIDAIKTFDIILVISGGGPGYASEILNLYAFRESLSYLNFGYGSVLLISLAVIVTVIAMYFNKIRRGGFWS
jgi:multiple sugar transport system permease protein